jgi:riboflavin kinase / FMN adenylyltransferase
LERFFSLAEFPESIGPSAVCIGKFDALHLGHQALFADLMETSEEQLLIPTVVTFDRHPDFLLEPARARLPILGKTQKHNLLELFGVEVMLEIPFTVDFAELSPEQFVQQILVDRLAAKVVLVGEGFRFGKHGAGNGAVLAEAGKSHGFSVRQVRPVEVLGQVVSTTRVRDLLDLGDVVTANRLLGRVHRVEGIVEHGLKIGRKIGFPTANIARDAEGYLPLDGVYSGWLIAGDKRYPAAHSVGINETFQAVPRLVESHVLDETDIDLYDQIVTLEFIDFVRPAAKFDGVDSLVTQIHLDLEVVRKQLGLK